MQVLIQPLRGNHQFNERDIHCRMESVTNGKIRNIHDL